MAILVTGGTGYIGSVTVELLQNRGEAVVILDDLRRGHRESLDPDVPFYQGEVGDRARIGIVTQRRQRRNVDFAIRQRLDEDGMLQVRAPVKRRGLTL